jgi:hypothetical protein
VKLVENVVIIGQVKLLNQWIKTIKLPILRINTR